MRPLKSEKGLALIVAVIILLVFAIMAVVMASLVSTDSDISLYQFRSGEAFYVALAGQQYTLMQTYPSARANPQVNIGSGGFIVDPPAALSAAITNVTNPISVICYDKAVAVDCTLFFPATGRILIESELIDYTGVTANSFTGATRGVGRSLAVSHASGQGVYHATALTAAVTSAATTIPVTSTSGFEVPGTIKIDQEFIYCTGAAGGFSACTRGTQGSTAMAHNSGATAIQVTVQVTGTVSTGIVGNAQRILQAQTGVYLDGWAMGNTATLARWNGINWDTVSVTTGRDINSGFMLDTNSDGAVDDGLAVGDRENAGGQACALNTPNIFRFTNGAWACANAGLNNNDRMDLNSVFAISSTDIWTVGTLLNRAGSTCAQNTPTIFHWNGASWACANTGLNNNDRMDLNSIFAISNTNVWAAGAFNNRGGQTCPANTPTIFHWDGINWSCVNTGDSDDRMDLNSVFAVSNTGIWVVGGLTNRNNATCANGSATILRWNGAAWACANIGAVAVAYNSIYMLDTDGNGMADNGWAVGAGGTLIRWNGTQWSAYSSPTANPLNEVFMVRQQNFVRLADWQEVY